MLPLNDLSDQHLLYASSIYIEVFTLQYSILNDLVVFHEIVVILNLIESSLYSTAVLSISFFVLRLVCRRGSTVRCGERHASSICTGINTELHDPSCMMSLCCHFIHTVHILQQQSILLSIGALHNFTSSFGQKHFSLQGIVLQTTSGFFLLLFTVDVHVFIIQWIIRTIIFSFLHLSFDCNFV